MPIGALLPALAGLVQAGVGVYQDKRNRRAQHEQNYADRQNQWNMYWQQRADAQSDWHMQNQYNSPQQQMQRFKEAGLNPHLIYGNQSNTPAVRSSSASADSQPAPRMDLSPIAGGIDAMFRIAQMTAQTSNIQAQKDLITAQTASTLQQTQRSVYDLDLAKDMRGGILEGQALGNQKLAADIMYTVNSDERAAIASTNNMAKTIQDILESKQRVLESQMRVSNNPIIVAKLKAEIASIRQITSSASIEKQIKEAQLALWKQGINPSDPVFYRKLLELLTAAVNRWNADPYSRTPDGSIDTTGFAKGIQFAKRKR